MQIGGGPDGPGLSLASLEASILGPSAPTHPTLLGYGSNLHTGPANSSFGTTEKAQRGMGERGGERKRPASAPRARPGAGDDAVASSLRKVVLSASTSSLFLLSPELSDAKVYEP